MQLGGIEREHTRSSHQVTNCMHEHTSYQKTGAAHAAASGMTEKLEQNRQEQLEMQASPLNWLEKLFQKLDSCGKSGLFSSQIIAADTGMKCTLRNTQRKNPYQTGGL